MVTNRDTDIYIFSWKFHFNRWSKVLPFQQFYVNFVSVWDSSPQFDGWCWDVKCSVLCVFWSCTPDVPSVWIQENGCWCFKLEQVLKVTHPSLIHNRIILKNNARHNIINQIRRLPSAVVLSDWSRGRTPEWCSVVGFLSRVSCCVNSGVNVNKLIFGSGTTLTITSSKSNINVNVYMRLNAKT